MRYFSLNWGYTNLYNALMYNAKYSCSWSLCFLPKDAGGSLAVSKRNRMEHWNDRWHQRYNPTLACWSISNHWWIGILSM